jgi:hypothetical protein
LDVHTDPDAEVRVKVGQRIFGPQLADTQGRARVPIEVAPDVRAAQVLGTGRGQRKSLSIPLEIPETRPVAAFISPSPLPPGEKGWLWVVGMHDDDLSKVQVTVEGGRARRLESPAGRRRYELLPDPAVTSLYATVAAGGQDPSAKIRVGVSISTKESLADAPAPLVLGRRPPGRLSTGISLGALYGGSQEVGFSGALQLAYYLPALQQRLALELGFGIRSVSFLHSSIVALPLEFSVRARLWKSGPWALDGLAGTGLIPLVQQTPLSGLPTEGGIGGETFAGVQLAHALRSFEWFLELRGSYAPMSTSTMNARLPWLSVSLGLRNL